MMPQKDTWKMRENAQTKALSLTLSFYIVYRPDLSSHYSRGRSSNSDEYAGLDSAKKGCVIAGI